MSIALMAMVTVGLAHDYLAWNRTRWVAINDLLRAGVSPSHIDGGFEFNGYILHSDGPKNGPGSFGERIPGGDDYLITFGEIDGYQVLGRHVWRRYLPFGPERILVLGRDAVP